MHASLSALFSVLVIAAMALSAVAYRGWFRLYSLATIAVVVGFGMATSFAIHEASPGFVGSAPLTRAS
ncbi:MAG TPA: hypothetical protein VF086_04430 [Propionibacteriaceae bacterium]